LIAYPFFGQTSDSVWRSRPSCCSCCGRGFCSFPLSLSLVLCFYHLHQFPFPFPLPFQTCLNLCSSTFSLKFRSGFVIFLEHARKWRAICALRNLKMEKGKKASWKALKAVRLQKTLGLIGFLADMYDRGDGGGAGGHSSWLFTFYQRHQNTYSFLPVGDTSIIPSPQGNKVL